MWTGRGRKHRWRLSRSPAGVNYGSGPETLSGPGGSALLSMCSVLNICATWVLMTSMPRQTSVRISLRCAAGKAPGRLADSKRPAGWRPKFFDTRRRSCGQGWLKWSLLPCSLCTRWNSAMRDCFVPVEVSRPTPGMSCRGQTPHVPVPSIRPCRERACHRPSPGAPDDGQSNAGNRWSSTSGWAFSVTRQTKPALSAWGRRPTGSLRPTQEFWRCTGVWWRDFGRVRLPGRCLHGEKSRQGPWDYLVISAVPGIAAVSWGTG